MVGSSRMAEIEWTYMAKLEYTLFDTWGISLQENI